MNFVPTFVLTLLTFLEGVFCDLRRLPEPFAAVSHPDPVRSLVEGMRFGLPGHSAVDPLLGVGFLVLLDLLAVGLGVALIRSGRKSVAERRAV